MIRNTGWIWRGFSGGNHSEQRKKGNIKGMQPLFQESHTKKCRLCSLTAAANFLIGSAYQHFAATIQKVTVTLLCG